MSFTNWLQNNLLPCPFKYLTGIDCPGCGFQRSLMELVQGNINKSWALYPPAIPLLFIFALFLANKFMRVGTNYPHFKRYLLITAAVVIMINYGFKTWGLYDSYTLSATAVK